MGDRFGEIRERIVRMAGEDAGIHAVIEIGSQARRENAADQYSDLDVIVVCDDSAAYLYGDEKLAQVGDIRISFVEDTIGGGRERRILFEGALDVDFIFVSREQLMELIETGFLDSFWERGYAVLYDEMGISGKITVRGEGQKKENHIGR